MKELSSRIEYSLMLVKPNLVRSGGVEEVKRKICESGAVEIVNEKEVVLDKEQALAIYGNTKANLSEVLKYVTSGPSYIFFIRGNRAVDRVCTLRGTTELGDRKASGLRHLYAINPLINSIHAPSSYEEAVRDITVLLKEESFGLLNFSQLGEELMAFFMSVRNELLANSSVFYRYAMTDIEFNMSNINRYFQDAFKTIIGNYFGFIRRDSQPTINIIAGHEQEFSLKIDLIGGRVHLSLPESSQSLRMISNNVLMASFLASQIANVNQDTQFLGIHGNTHYAREARTGIIISSIENNKGKTALSMLINDMGLDLLSDEYTIFNISSPALYVPRFNLLTLRQDFLDHIGQLALNRWAYLCSYKDLIFFNKKNCLPTDTINSFLNTRPILLFFINDSPRIVKLDKDNLISVMLTQATHHFKKFGIKDEELSNINTSIEEKLRRLATFCSGYLLPKESSFGSQKNREFIKGVVYAEL